MKISYYFLSIIGFGISVVSSFILFAGLFSAKWDYVVNHLFDTIFVLFFGTLIPLGYITGLIFLVKGIISKSKDRSYLILTVSIAAISSILTLALGLPIFMSSVLELYRIKLGIA